MLSAESSSGLMTPASTFLNRGVSAGEHAGTHFSFPASAMAARFLASSGGGTTECSSTTSSGAVVATMSRRKSMMNSISTFLLREVP